eukprot:CAMPEP_0176352860 /NCGR_PEP_ID=MMETSP0126-20121128/11371_1 /TAXON_ID=141414 ORGANISM="Strombidinopsis acuminatum, Strain SPMC142" /NCGR_SAMPLE_ID=MMETSP0126 /ASSEMBLY_ACC=CAM_ASM_000229 /LENGTH=30 /DNA_ID= /DNA_START= /DNA_END= /DNA_ORIENTATION=
MKDKVHPGSSGPVVKVSHHVMGMPPLCPLI